MTKLAVKLRCHTSILGLAVASSLIAFPAGAQVTLPPSPGASASGSQGDVAPPTLTPGAEDSAAPTPVQTAAPSPGSTEVPDIVVTGTSIRGITPIGSNLVTVGRADIESTASVNVQQILKSVPSLTAMGGSGQGQLPGVSYYSPTIHSLGSSASNSTLVLIDGHRIPQGATIAHPLPDPSMVPVIAIERVEVLAEGASATYGADAVAGVVNFVTRKRFDGLQVNAQYGFGTDYNTKTVGALFGHVWDTGSAMAAYGFSYASSLPYNYKANPFLQPDLTQLAADNGLPAGNTNNLRFTCDPATLQPGGAGNIFTSATSGVSVPNNIASRFCDIQAGDFLGAEKRHNGLVRITQEFGRLTMSVDAVFSLRYNTQHTARGTLTATAFQTGAQANPFYVRPAGYTGTATTELIQFNADQLLGPGGAVTKNNAETWFTTANLEYRVTDKIRLTALANFGQDTGDASNFGRLCTSCATLALNGTTNSGGSTTAFSIPGTRTSVLNLPLTTANALDVWNPAATNRTSRAVLAQLTDSFSTTHALTRNRQFRVGADGEAFALPAGPLRVAVGLEANSYSIDTTVVSPGNYGPAITTSSSAFYPFTRSVRSAFGELAIPLIGPDMDIPLVRKLDVDLSARYDHYSDFGSTSNPKVSVDWTVTNGLKLRGNWSTAFVAPSPRSIGDPTKDGLNSISTAALATDSAVVSVAAFPNIIGVPGCPPGSVTCSIGSAVPGINRYTGDPNLKPETGRTWSVGVDFAPAFLPGFAAAVTLFNNKIKGGITSPLLPNILTTGSLYNKLTFCPTGCTQAQIDAFIGPARITSVLAPITYYLYDRRQGNFLNLDLTGLDFSVQYRKRTDSIGLITLGVTGTYFLKYDQAFAGGPKFSVLNTTGYNVTYPSIALQSRFNVGWAYDSFDVDLFVNYIGSYHDWSSATLVPVTIDPVLRTPTGGGARVKANATVDAHVSYKLDKIGIGILSQSEVYADARNLLNRDPPFVNGTGYDPYSGNPIGRVISIGIRTRF